jgi:hypothetical protein
MIPDCGDMDCTNCVVQWKEGRRYVKHEGAAPSFEEYVATTLKRIDEALRRLESYRGLVP